MIFLRHVNHTKVYLFCAELNDDNFYMKIIDLQLSNFEFFHLKSLRCSKKIMAYLDLRVFLTFNTCSLTPLESNLTAVAWRATKKVGAVALKSAELF